MEERYEVRGHLFQQQLERRRLETRLAQAKKRELLQKHHAVAEELASTREDQKKKTKTEHEELTERYNRAQEVIRESKLFWLALGTSMTAKKLSFKQHERK